MTGTWSSSAKRSQLGRGPRPQDAAAGQDDRALGRGEELDDRADLVVAGARGAGRALSAWRVVGDRLVEEVLGERQQDGPGPAAERLADRLGHRRRRPRRRSRGSAAHLASPPSVATWSISWNASRPEQRALDLADRRRTSASSPGAPCGSRWRGSRRRRRGSRGRRRAAGQLAVGLGHERGGALVAGGDDPDPGALEGVEQAEERLARDGEGVADAGRAEASAMKRPTVRGPSATAGSRSGSARRARLGVGLGRRSSALGFGHRVAGRGGSSAVSGSGTASTSGVSGAASGAARRSGIGRRAAPARAPARARDRLDVGAPRPREHRAVGRRGRSRSRRRRRDDGSSGWRRGVELGHGDSAPSVGVAPAGDGQR